MATDSKTPTDTAEVQWTTVSEAPEDLTRVSFSIVNQQFIGRYTGYKNQQNARGSYVQLRFMGGDGVAYFINPGYTMKEGMRKVPRGAVVRITLTGFKDVGKGSQMQLVSVEMANLSPGAPIPTPAVSDESMTALPERSDYDEWESYPTEEPPF